MAPPATARSNSRRSSARCTNATLAAILCAVGAGCSCSDTTTVLPITRQQYYALGARYGQEALPDYECEALCMRSVTVVPDGCAQGGGAGSGGTSGTGGQGGTGAPPWCAPQQLQQFVSITECKLATIEWIDPAVICTGRLPCEG